MVSKDGKVQTKTSHTELINRNYINRRCTIDQRFDSNALAPLSKPFHLAVKIVVGYTFGMKQERDWLFQFSMRNNAA